MFKFLPSYNLILESHLSAEECERKIKEYSEEKKVFKLAWKAPVYSKPYIGFIADGEFEIHRNITYRNSFLPIIRGKISSKALGADIQISMTLAPFVKVFIGLWLSFILFFCFIVILNLFKASFSAFFIIPFIMATFGFMLSHGAFNYERKQSVGDLKSIFEAELKSIRK